MGLFQSNERTNRPPDLGAEILWDPSSPCLGVFFGLSRPIYSAHLNLFSSRKIEEEDSLPCLGRGRAAL